MDATQRTMIDSKGNPARSSASLTLRGISKHYGDFKAADNIDLEVGSGEFVTFLGPSGSGKTTTLQIVAGFVRPTAGEVLVDGRPVTAPPHKRDIGMVFQNYALFPHMTAGQNVDYPLKVRKIDKQERRRRVHEALEMVGLADRADRYPKQLSGGQQQRIALARALVFRPRIVLLDEPLGALDKKLREHLQLEIKRIQHELGITMIYVTHDQEEALVMSDRIAVFNEGRIQQVGTAEEVYERPTSLFVADFVGESNILRGRLKNSDGKSQVVADRLKLTAPPIVPPELEGAQVALIIRPERLNVRGGKGRPPLDEDAVEATVEEVIYLGNERKYVLVDEAGDRLVARQQVGAVDEDLGVGEKVIASWRPENSVLVPA